MAATTEAWTIAVEASVAWAVAVAGEATDVAAITPVTVEDTGFLASTE